MYSHCVSSFICTRVQLLANSGDEQSQTVVRSAAEELLSTCHSVNMFILNKYSEMRILTSAEVCCDICSHFVSVVDNANANTSEELHLELAKQCEVGMQLCIVLNSLAVRYLIVFICIH